MSHPFFLILHNFTPFLLLKLTTVHWSPFFDHIKDGWSHRDDENVLFLHYEVLQSDLSGSLKKLAIFLGKPLKDDDMPKLLDHLSIKNFRNNPALNCQDLVDVKLLSRDAQGFVRNGKEQKNSELSEEMIRKIDKLIEINLSDSDFKFRS